MGARSLGWLAFLGSLIATLLVALIAVVVTDDGSAGGTGTSAPSSIAVASTAAPETTISAVSTTDAIPATTSAPPATAAPTSQVGRCDGLPSMIVPGDAVYAGGANGAFGGNPEPESIMQADVASLFHSGGAYYVSFSLNAGYTAFRQLPDPTDPGFVPEILVVNFDGDDDAAWVKIDHSLAAGADVYAFYFLDEQCEVEDAGTDEVPRYDFLDWAGAQHTQGFSCDGGGVYETLAGASSTAGMWDITNTYYQWTAPALPGFSLGFQDGIQVPDGDPEIEAAGTVNC